jgi:cytochrome c oxidase subunit 3
LSSHGSRALAHQFEDLDQQREVASLGMWLFLVTEVLFFGGLFLVYSIYRGWYPEAFAASSHELLVWAGTLNTVVLITSSLTMALAVHAAQTGHRRALIGLLLATMILGCAFLGVKAFEYRTEYLEHHIPGAAFQFEPEHFLHAQIFFSLYFIMTGLHALHMIIGVGLLAWLIVKAQKNEFSPAYNTPVDLVGLYWHFVDIIWIFLFPLLYLLGRHTT